MPIKVARGLGKIVGVSNQLLENQIKMQKKHYILLKYETIEKA